MLARHNQLVETLRAPIDATACLVGGIKVRTLASILMSVLKDHTGAHSIRGVSIRKARTVAAAFLVGETMVIILVLTLTNVFKDVTIARPTHTASIHRDHIDVTATGVTINLEVAVMVCISPLRKLRIILYIAQKRKCRAGTTSKG